MLASNDMTLGSDFLGAGAAGLFSIYEQIRTIDFTNAPPPFSPSFLEVPGAHTLYGAPPMSVTSGLRPPSSSPTSSATGACSPSLSPRIDAAPGDTTGGFRREVGSDAHTAASLRRRNPAHKPNPAYRCGRCGKTFTRNKNYMDHLLRHDNRRRFACIEDGCASRFNTTSDRDNHVRKIHGTSSRCQSRAASQCVRGS
ncbi:hypothetical protein BD626DRAFT_512351 [Schizophyllum amplum]|uniref:C2H2-type domain-containing protein n=1 Tax=Schizophyllum amplum TaxID=97359 RepID=A0A550C041_9AGAR|nr:hypothetical protein BD626DRAFT_512351 [Auriculariopsis ampla]